MLLVEESVKRKFELVCLSFRRQRIPARGKMEDVVSEYPT